MKKTTLILAGLAAAGAANAQSIGVTVDGRAIDFPAAQPVMENNSVLVPLRGVFEQLGAQVLWDQRTQQVTAIKGDRVIKLGIGERVADVAGRAITLNTPARLHEGTTLVPLRFLSEALGARVRWNPNNEMVMINTLAPGRAEPLRDSARNDDRDRRDDRPARRDAIATLYRDTVIPVKLDDALSSNESRTGDRFTASLASVNGVYGQLPGGTKIEGRVVNARRQSGTEPGLLELSFDRLVLPDGTTEDLSGTLVSLSDKNLKTDADGRIVATGQAKDNRGVYAGYGAGAGVLLGVLSGDNVKGNVSKALLGGLLGLGVGEYQRQQARQPSNVRLTPGEKFGVRLDDDLTVYRNR